MSIHRPTCAFTGHRAAKLPWRFDEEDPRCARLKQRIYDAASCVYVSGVRRFICGMANGCDLYFCEAVLSLRSEHPEVFLEAAIPFEGQAARWPREQRERYARLIAECDERTLLQKQYSEACLMKRNRYMVDNADILIAAYSGKSGGTLHTIRYAMSRGLQIIALPIEE